jgi:predicted methyltransferase
MPLEDINMKLQNYFIFLLLQTNLSFAADLYQNALNSISRPEQDREADTRRKPESVLAFFQIAPGQKVLDLFSGGGYYTELTSTVVGENGHVDAHNNSAYIKYIGEEKLLKRYSKNRLPNVTQIHQEADELSLCTACYDRVLMVLTFHDLFYVDDNSGWPKIDAPRLMEKVRNSMKPGALLGIIDHNAQTGAGIDVAQTLHRIDPQMIKSLMQKWGFSLKNEADFLLNPLDNGDLPMWDPSVRGHTNRSVMLFNLSSG